MKDFTFFAPTRILFGKGKIAELPGYVKDVADKVLLVYGGGSVKRTGIYDTLTSLLKSAGIAGAFPIRRDGRLQAPDL